MKLLHPMFNQQNRTTLSPDVIPLTSQIYTMDYFILCLKNVWGSNLCVGSLKKWLPSTVYDRLYTCGMWKGIVVTDFFVSTHSTEGNRDLWTNSHTQRSTEHS